jgi:hypothetical protein
VPEPGTLVLLFAAATILITCCNLWCRGPARRL